MQPLSKRIANLEDHPIGIRSQVLADADAVIRLYQCQFAEWERRNPAEAAKFYDWLGWNPRDIRDVPEEKLLEAQRALQKLRAGEVSL